MTTADEINAWNRANERARRAYQGAEQADHALTKGVRRAEVMRKNRAAKKAGGPQMARRYWLTEQGYAALEQADEGQS